MIDPDRPDWRESRYSMTAREVRGWEWWEWGRENSQRLLADGGIESATIEDCRRLWMAFERQERFCEGALTSAIEDGTIDRLRKRIDQLLADD